MKTKIASLLTVAAVLFSTAAFAYPRHPHYAQPVRYYGPRVVVAPRYIAPRPVIRFVPRVPYGAVRVYVGPQPYFYSGGLYYQWDAGRNGYLVVPAPM